MVSFRRPLCLGFYAFACSVSLAAAQEVAPPSSEADAPPVDTSAEAPIEDPAHAASEAPKGADEGDRSTPQAEDDDEDYAEIVVKAQSHSENVRTSPESVTVVDLATAKRESETLGERLARTEGVTVQRTGGLGSSQRVALDGFGDDQIRIFLDQIPLSYTGLGTTLADVPVDLVDRIQVYHGVVPIELGADALGGAIDLQSALPKPGVHGRFSWQGGSWDTHRLAFALSQYSEKTGLGMRAGAFFDTARNNWPIDVQVADLSGKISDAQVTRLNDAYRAGGGYASFLVRERFWADAFTLTAMASNTYKQIPHNQVMTVPYGDVWWGGTSAGATADWKKLFASVFQLRVLAAYGYRQVRLVDESEDVVDWYGRKIATRPRPGELDTHPHDRMSWQHGIYGRITAKWLINPQHALIATFTPDITFRTGQERDLLESEPRDPYAAKQHQYKFVTGLGWDGSFVDGKLRLSAFGKSYVYRAATGGIDASYRYVEKEQALARFGGGAGLSYAITDQLYLKGNYEYATRLPNPDEVFGDGVLVAPNLDLAPEKSHNANLELQLVEQPSPIGTFDASLRGIARFADDLVVLLSRDVTLQWQNVYNARALGIHAALSWTSPGDWVALSGTATWTDLRNRSSDGPFASYAGDRIPNRPWLNATGQLRVQGKDVGKPGIDLQGYWVTRYVHSFYRSWASIGLASSKQMNPDQISHALGVTLAAQTSKQLGISTSLELFNLTNARLFDVFGVQRPGRTVMGKIALTW